MRGAEQALPAPTITRTPTDGSSPRRTAVLCGILILAALVRVYWINQPFVDFNGWRESSTAMMAENILHRGNLLYPEVNWDGPGPSYNGREFQLVTLLASAIYRVTGQVDWVGRLVGVLFGLWGIFALYKLISLVWDERRALAGAAVMAVFPGSLFIDREFLPDPGMVSLVTTGCWLAVAYLRFGRRRDLVWSTLAMTAGVLTKLTGLCVVLAIAYAALSIQSGSSQVRRRSLFIAGLAMLVPVALYYAWAWHLSRTYPPYHFAGSQGFIWHSTFATWWAEGYFATGLWQETRNIWTGLGLVLMAVALPLRPAPVRSGAPYFFHWWLLISGGSYFAIGASHLIGQPYNFHLFDPAAAALAGHTVITIANASRRRIGVLASGIVVVALPLAIGLSGLPYLRMVYGSFSSDAYRMGIALRQLSAPTDLVVTIPEYAGNPVAIYYARRHGWVFPPASVWSTIPENWDEVIMQPAAETWLDGLRTEGARWFAIVAAQKERLWRLNPSLADYVDRHFEIRQETEGYTIFQLR